jgi:PGF-CTERM protein
VTTRKATATLLVALIAASAVTGAAAAATSGTQESSAYAGTHVSFDVQQSAVVDYAVGGETVLDSVAVQSESTGGAGGVFDGSVSLSSVTQIQGSGLSLAAQANAQATISASSSAELRAHDNDHGILVVDSGGDDQVVVANVSQGASASAESDSQVTVTTADGTKSTFIVVGDGSVTVNDDGDVSTKLQGDAKLVFRSYPDGKSEQSDQTEAYIASGKATAEVYVEQQDGEMVTDTVTYGQEMSVEAKQSAENTVQVTVDRTKSQGKVVVTSVSEAAVGSVEDLQVTVDGEAAVQGSSYGELDSAFGADSSKYLVKQSASASATAKVYVALNHFSERTVQMSGAGSDDETTTTTADGDQNDDTGGDSNDTGGSPGFGVGVALVALLGAALVAIRK